MEILKTFFKGLTVLQTRKTASLDLQTNNEEIVYACMNVLSLLTQSNYLSFLSFNNFILKTNNKKCLLKES